MQNTITENIETVILAGGTGERLRPLTEYNAKPAVPFGGKYKIIDFVLSNCLHSKLRKIYVLPQYEPFSLHDHLDSWSSIFNSEMGEYLKVIFPYSQAGKDLSPYVGTADAVLKSMRYILRGKPEHVLILAGDQIYKMDYREIIDFHRGSRVGLTMAVVESNREVAQRSGVVVLDKYNSVVEFEEKPGDPRPLPGNPDRFLVSMSAYVFSTEFLVQELEDDFKDHESKHDFGKNILNKML